MKRKLLSGALALVMLAGCTAPVPDTQKLPDDGGEETRVAYVPLDDRPVNTDRVEYLAGSLGYELVMPDEEDYRTRLDEQPLGESGLKYGDRAALYEWVLEQEESGCDRYILSLDQLLSGGLVNSRCFTGEDVTLGDGTTMTETELIESLFAALDAPENEIWVIDTVMRLAPTVGYDGNTLEDYNALREYARIARPELSGDELTIENIVRSYPLDESGSVIAFDENVTSVYFKARERKLELIDCALRATEAWTMCASSSALTTPRRLRASRQTSLRGCAARSTAAARCCPARTRTACSQCAKCTPSLTVPARCPSCESAISAAAKTVP